MEIREAQREVRSVYLGGSAGQIVSGLIWLASALAATVVNRNLGLIILVLGGVFIFPLTTLAVKLLGSRGTLSKGNPFNYLAMQIAFIVPLAIPIILPLASANPNWFYPAFALVVGAHYLPFATLYGMNEYLILAGALLFTGIGVRYLAPDSFALAGWITGAILVLFGIVIALRRRGSSD